MNLFRVKMQAEIDIYENEIYKEYPGLLDILLKDHTTQKNIFWATDHYTEYGEGYDYFSHISPELITGQRGNIIMPRVKKGIELQQNRAREMGEVFSPAWICNAQNNLIDNAWFGRENVFNAEIITPEGNHSWITTKGNIAFPEGKSWSKYISDKRLEMTCGEAPYITSRYDTTTGEAIPLENRIGILDRKLRVINENVNESGKWLEAAQKAYKSTYAFEWQGDSLLLAREAMLVTFIDNFKDKFKKDPLFDSIKYIAYIISWNVWQMDGLKGVVPNSCKDTITTEETLFDGSISIITPCEGCKNDILTKHNGTYCKIKDWGNKDPETGKKGRKIKFIDIITKSK